MDNINLIRSGIFLVAGLSFLIIPEKAWKLSFYLAKKLHITSYIKYNLERDKKHYPYLGVIFLIISLILFIYSINN
ncbi:MAG: hypothetical protein QGF74_01995 [Candidatus Nanoarchaeia archaeon]|jgi:hypothetical protein|nr:hypothetical protein [Candidatus Nanoarchaeia archaeon]|tara:strand:- start:42551 stop:42778 length:228 start_codon:yes stop_codon:yes gene_type:complete